MSQKLVICEKPSVAKSISDVLGAKTRKDGSYEGGGYVVSWCVGHLLGLAEPQAYDEKYAKWRYEDLPIIPAEWQYIANKDTKKQLTILCDLMKRSDVDCIVNACDAGREGELIFRLVYEHAKCNKPIIGYDGDTMEKAEKRLRDTWKAGFFPFAMLYRDEKGEVQQDWKQFQRLWARPQIINQKLKEGNNA